MQRSADLLGSRGSTCDDQLPTILVQPSANDASHKLVLLALTACLLLPADVLMSQLV